MTYEQYVDVCIDNDVLIDIGDYREFLDLFLKGKYKDIDFLDWLKEFVIPQYKS